MIQEIKNKLDIQQVLSHYGLKVNRSKMLNCPFHEDKTPSMQVYPETNTAYCFSSNCKLHGKSIDQIDFILYIENLSKKEAIEKAKQMAGIIEQNPKEQNTLEETFQILRKNLIRSSKAQNYLKERKLSDINEIGYNYRTLKELRDCIIFPLKNKEGKIVSLYGRSILNTNGRHYYTTNRQGLYPNYPSTNVKRLILTESIIDALTINEHTNYKVLALYGTNGLTKEHLQAINDLGELKEIIFFMDGDASGDSAVEKYTKSLNQLYPEITISKVETPKGEDPNSLVQSHEPEILSHLIENREKIFGKDIPNTFLQKCHKLDISNTSYLHFISKNVQVTIMGGINTYPIDRLKVTLKIEKTDSCNPLHKIRHTIDLYNDDQVEKLLKKTSDRLEIGSKELQIVITELIEELENYREQKIETQKPKKVENRKLTPRRKEKAIEWLETADLLKRTSELIGHSGVIGEETNRLLMYLIFTSRLREQPLHVISLGSSGTGKTYLQEKISELIPEEQKLEITTLSENALYYFERTELKNKLVLIEDLDGANDDKVLYAIRELMSKKRISKTIPIKDNQGNLKTITLQVEGPISLAGTTTREKLYEDNANRSILIYLDNSKQHKESIMDYQRKLSSGRINKSKEEEIKEFIKDVQTVLRPIKVVNTYAEQLKIPETDFKPLRTNAHYLNFIEVITFYKQYQREHKIDKNGEKYIETTLEDIKEANELIKEVLLTKSDELTKAARNFLQMIKHYLKLKSKETFYSKELRQEYRIAPATLKRYLLQLNRYGCLQIIGGTKNKGYEYELATDNYDNIKHEIDTSLEKAYKNLAAQWLTCGSPNKNEPQNVKISTEMQKKSIGSVAQ